MKVKYSHFLEDFTCCNCNTTDQNLQSCRYIEA